MLMKKKVMVFLVILVVFGYGCANPSSEINEEAQEEQQAEVQDQPAVDVKEQAIAAPEEETAEPQDEPIEKVPKWVYGGPAIEGNYADSDFVDLGNGKYKMYYAIEPEVPGNKLEVYSATSSDGIKWVQENGGRGTI